MVDEATDAVRGAVRRLMDVAEAPVLLAVSGGLDSMSLLHATIAVARDRIAGVASFDHGTGPAATQASLHVARVARAAGLRIQRGLFNSRTPTPDGREAAWRIARYDFLRTAARRAGACIVTAHSLDDQLETVLMRLMRHAGARGLAGLHAGGDIMRPFTSVRRGTLLAYAQQWGVQWVEDPSNGSPAFARNRIRRDILPALRRADPSLDASLLALAGRAAEWRGDVERFIDSRVRPTLRARGELVVASVQLADYDRDSLAMLWSALAGRVGLVLDQRGTRRIAAFTSSRPRGGSIPLAGGWRLEATREAYILERESNLALASPARLPTAEAGSLEWGRFRFRVASEQDAGMQGMSSPWSAAIGADSVGLVRTWRAGDRLEPASGQPRRRVTRYLSDVGVQGSERAGWPVVVAGDEVIWIPGVRRSDAATDRSGRPVRHYICERIDR